MLLDFKHSNETGHKNLTGLGQKHVLEFARVLEEKRIPTIARHVVVPGITDDETHLQDLGKLLAGFRNLKGLEVLPYHTMGKVKYDKLGLSYPLEMCIRDSVRPESLLPRGQTPCTEETAAAQ